MFNQTTITSLQNFSILLTGIRNSEYLFKFEQYDTNAFKKEMYNNKKIVVVLPAYNAALTLEKTYQEIPFDIVDEVILVDDDSKDNTFDLANKLGIKHIIHHEENKGYGGNQKTCYKKALELGADIVIMLHPDYQYTPLLIPAMVSIIGRGLYPLYLDREY